MHKEHLLTEFTGYLEQLDEQPLEQEETRTPDLLSLHGAMIGLQSEVKSEARLFKGALDDFRSVFQTLQNGQTHSQAELERLRQELAQQRSALLKPVLLEWLEMRDRMTASIEHLHAIMPRGFKAHWQKGRLKAISAMLEGQQLSLRKLDARLASYQAIPLDCLGKPFDPNSMHALSVVVRPELDNGIVT